MSHFVEHSHVSPALEKRPGMRRYLQGGKNLTRARMLYKTHFPVMSVLHRSRTESHSHIKISLSGLVSGKEQYKSSLQTWGFPEEAWRRIWCQKLPSGIIQHHHCLITIGEA